MGTSTKVRRSGRSRTARLVAVVGAVVGLAIPLAGTAHATGARDGYCDPGEFCLYYYGAGTTSGSLSDFAVGNIPDLGPTQPTCYEFRGAGYGKGECVWRNAESAWNRTGHDVRVFTNVRYTNTSDLFTVGGPRGNLNLAYNLAESIKFL
jgi:hypothetical protein